MVLRTLYLDRLRRPFPRGTVRVLSGVRRSGKTTLLDQLAGALCPGGAVQGEYVRIGLTDEEGGYPFAGYKKLLNRSGRRPIFLLLSPRGLKGGGNALFSLTTLISSTAGSGPSGAS